MTPGNFHAKKSVAETVANLRKDSRAPLSAMIEIADRCNEVCVHCYQVQGLKGEMSTEQIKAILDELANMGVLFLTFSGGEATLRKDFLELVTYARELKFSVKIYTNGLRISDELAKTFSDLAVQEVQISLYSHQAHKHDWVTRVPGSWEKTVNNIKRLIREKVKVVVKSPLMSFNGDEHDEYASFVKSLGADFMMDVTLDPREDGDRTPEMFRILDEQYLGAFKNPQFAHHKKRAQLTKEQKGKQHVCGACSGNVHIEANGEMRPCTQMTVPVGHALKDGIRSSWENNKDAAFIRKLTWNDLHGCRDCDLQPYCTRCFAVGRTEHGDALGPYPSACHKAQLNYQVRNQVAPTILSSHTPGVTNQTGPYRCISDQAHTFEAIEDQITAQDNEVRKQFQWVLATKENANPSQRLDQAKPGDLIQIRRPGAKKLSKEMVPK